MLLSDCCHKQLTCKMAWPSYPHRSSRLLSTGLEAHLFLWLKGKRATHDEPSCVVLQAICGPFLRSIGTAWVTKSTPRRHGTWGLAAPELAQALIFLVLNCWGNGWNQKQNATLHAHWSLGSGKRKTVARVLAVPNPLLDLKLSSTELPNSLGETGLWVGVSRGGGREESSSWLISRTSSEAAPFLQGSVTAGLCTYIRVSLCLTACYQICWFDSVCRWRVVWNVLEVFIFHLLFFLGVSWARWKSRAKALEGNNHIVKEWCLSVAFWKVFWGFTSAIGRWWFRELAPRKEHRWRFGGLGFEPLLWPSVLLRSGPFTSSGLAHPGWKGGRWSFQSVWLSDFTRRGGEKWWSGSQSEPMSELWTNSFTTLCNESALPWGTGSRHSEVTGRRGFPSQVRVLRWGRATGDRVE